MVGLDAARAAGGRARAQLHDAMLDYMNAERRWRASPLDLGTRVEFRAAILAGLVAVDGVLAATDAFIECAVQAGAPGAEIADVRTGRAALVSGEEQLQQALAVLNTLAGR